MLILRPHIRECMDSRHLVYGLRHPAMKMMIRLASMEIRSENHIHIAVFFRFFNKMVGEVKGEENYKFKPRYFVCDEGGANYKEIQEVYGDEFCKA